ncbi:MAG: hypothetical protein H7263_03395 [Candidatus Sericytochromatia bacterium]|nr:hypothetical protein [Candidatus Sericytochromatia bacterium]
MTKNKQVPKTLIFENTSFDDIDLISPESLFENFENDQENIVYLSSPEELFAKIGKIKEVKLKSPEELWGNKLNKNTKNNSSKNGKKSTK